MKLRTLILLPLFGISIGLAETCAPKFDNSPVQPGPNDVVFDVTTTYPRFEDQNIKQTATGKFLPSEKVTLKAQVAGQIEKINFNEGDQVKAGDVLCTIKNEDLNASIDKKEAEIKETEAIIEHDQKSMEMSQRPPEQKKEMVFLDEDDAAPDNYKKNEPVVLAQPAGMDWNTKIQAFQTKLERLKLEMEELQGKVAKLTVTAPISGNILKKYTSEGTFLEENQTLFDLIAQNPIDLSFFVPTEVSAFVDRQVKITATPEGANSSPVEGSIIYISPAVDSVTNQIEIKARFFNDQGLLREGMTAQVSIATRKIDRVLLVPKTSVVKEGDKQFIYTVWGNKTRKAEVKWAKDAGPNDLSVDANIRIDDPIVVSGHAGLKEGSFIRNLSSQNNGAL